MKILYFIDPTTLHWPCWDYPLWNEMIDVLISIQSPGCTLSHPLMFNWKDLSLTFSAFGRVWGKKEGKKEEEKAPHLSASVINATSSRLSPSRLPAVTQLNKCAVTPASPTCSESEKAATWQRQRQDVAAFYILMFWLICDDFLSLFFKLALHLAWV